MTNCSIWKWFNLDSNVFFFLRMWDLFSCSVIFIFGPAYLVLSWWTTSSWMENVTIFRVGSSCYKLILLIPQRSTDFLVEKQNKIQVSLHRQLSFIILFDMFTGTALVVVYFIVLAVYFFAPSPRSCWSICKEKKAALQFHAKRWPIFPFSTGYVSKAKKTQNGNEPNVWLVFSELKVWYCMVLSTETIF